MSLPPVNLAPTFGYLVIEGGAAQFRPLGARDGDETWVTAKEAQEIIAQVLGRQCSLVMVYRWVNDGRLRCRRQFQNKGLEIAVSSIKALDGGS